MRTLFAIATVLVLFAVGSLAFAQTPIPDPQAPTMEPLATAAPAPAVITQSDQPVVDELLSFSVGTIVAFVIALGAFIIALYAAFRSPDPDAQLAAAIVAARRNPDLVAPMERVYNAGVPPSSQSSLMETLTVFERLVDRALPQSVTADNAAFDLVREVTDRDPVIAKLEQELANERAEREALATRVASLESDTAPDA